jgi:DNA modification methylase
VPAATQDALYREIDLELSWSEAALPQRERTKHVHGLHPYLGKFVPQLAETLLRRHVPTGGRVLDPFCGSGTTLVEAAALGIEATGVDVSAFNVLLTREKLRRHAPLAPERGLRATLLRAERRWAGPSYAPTVPDYLRRWHSERAARELCAYRDAIDAGAPHAGLASLVLTRAARSARLVPHHALDDAREPVTEPYRCRKHRRTCVPTAEAARFLRRYGDDCVARIRAFEAVRTSARCEVLHADSREVALAGRFDAVVTSPPYVGVLDYHDQHAYAYALLELDERRAAEIGPRAAGATRSAVRAYCDDMAAALANARSALAPDGSCVIVVNDRLGLYDGILAAAGLRLESRTHRHVNRRTGRRAGEYFEEILVARAA